ncbi:MAG: thioredoxin-disulfide reductase [Thermodesulfovibrionales bacterium]
MDFRETYDVIIVGGGPAGLSAGLYCKRAVLKSVLLEKGLLGGQIAISKDVENYPGLEGITGFDLAEKMAAHARAFGLEIIQDEVVSIQAAADRAAGPPGLHSVDLAGGDRLGAVALILALGGSVRKLGVPGEAEYLGSGVSYCATCDGFFFKGKTAVVVGGGDTAVEEALYLARLAGKVYLVHRRDSLRASRLLQDRLMADPRIEVIWDTVVREIKGERGAVNAVFLENARTGEKRELPTDGVFVFIGYSPNSRLIPPGVRMNERGFVVTDEKCETSVPGIFAAGDLRHKFANQIVVAAADGCIAALGAAHYIENFKAGPGGHVVADLH